MQCLILWLSGWSLIVSSCRLGCTGLSLWLTGWRLVSYGSILGLPSWSLTSNSIRLTSHIPILAQRPHLLSCRLTPTSSILCLTRFRLGLAGFSLILGAIGTGFILILALGHLCDWLVLFWAMWLADQSRWHWVKLWMHWFKPWIRCYWFGSVTHLFDLESLIKIDPMNRQDTTRQVTTNPSACTGPIFSIDYLLHTRT